MQEYAVICTLGLCRSFKADGLVSPILDVECGVVGRVEGGDVADKILDVVEKLRFAIAKSKSSYHSHRQPLRCASHSDC